MTREETLMGRPVRSLQTMLRTLAQQEGLRISVIPDGIYGQNTMSAVLRFQQINGLPATGVADLQTWNAIAAQYRAIVSADSCFFSHLGTGSAGPPLGRSRRRKFAVAATAGRSAGKRNLRPQGASRSQCTAGVWGAF